MAFCSDGEYGSSFLKDKSHLFHVIQPHTIMTAPNVSVDEPK